MASSSSLTSILTSCSSPPSLQPKSLTQFDSPSSSSSSKIFYGRNFRAFWDISVKAFSSSFFQGGFGTKYDLPNPHGSGITAVEDEEEEPQCPPGLRQYETMAVWRSNMSEDERLALTNKYEELLVAGGAMYVEVFNRGIIPLAYSIKKKNKAGETNTYLDGIFLLFTYFTKPESTAVLEATLKADDDVIRSFSCKIRKRKY